MNHGPQELHASALAPSTAAAAFLERTELRMHALLDRRRGTVVEAARHAVAAGGKRLRPLLVRAAAPLHADSRFGDQLIAAAASVELIHTASLVHDDLLDGASLRRGAATVHALHGERVAVAAGDLLFSLAFTCLLDLRERAGTSADTAREAVLLAARSARILAEGEALQQEQTGDLALSIDRYLLRCERKTGELFGLAMELAGVVCGAPVQDVKQLGRFGREVGVAFQVADDVLDCLPPSAAAQLGKVPGADLRDRTMTLPILLATQRDAELATALAAGPPGDVEEALRRIDETGALADASRQARGLADVATELLDGLIGDYDVDSLRLVAASSVERIN